jgi:UDP-N-acetylglucosamine 4,6-dehydratase
VIKEFAAAKFTALINWPRKGKVVVLVLADAGVVLGSYYLILAIIYSKPWPIDELLLAASSILDFMVLMPLSFSFFGLYRQMIRHGGVALFIEVLKGVSLTILMAKLISIFLFNNGFSDRFFLELWSLLIIGSLGTRLLAKWLIMHGVARPRRHRISIAIFGAGEAGVSLLNALERNLDMKVVALFDDEKRFHKRKIKGCTVYHSSKMNEILKSHQVSEIIIAIPSISRKSRHGLLKRLEILGVRVRILPSVDEMMDGRVNVSDIRDVNASDVLNRKCHLPDEKLISRDVTGKNVMVTGGGGSIGSELCRQILLNQAGKLVVFENTEFAIYEIEQELEAMARSGGIDINIIPVLGDVCNKDLVARTLARHEIQTIYHAAAYKHVPMVESNVCEGLRNNVFGTLSIARAAMENNVSKLVLVSTDKAVRPTNVMGASKRLAEMVLQGLQDDGNVKTGTLMTMVRFGNVLDSAGSVVPLFRRQIRKGGPITLTHKDVTRYFMTIPEAAQLVMQAGAMAAGGEVYLLDMGKPIRVYDLAEKMIRLSGLSVLDQDNPDGDIKIEISGLRPGEKLHEELFLTDQIRKTGHDSIMQAHENRLEWDKLDAHLRELLASIKSSDEVAVRSLLEYLVEGYTSQSNELKSAQV